MARAEANGISIEYESFGDPQRETVLLIMGAGGQLTAWPIELCDELVTRGFHVVRFDNRDAGLSTNFESAGLPDWDRITQRLAEGRSLPEAYAEIPYTLEDMAADAVGLLDALEIESAHIVGASLGGMIAQLVASDYPNRTLSLTLMMTNSGNPDLMIKLPPSKVSNDPGIETFADEQVALFQALTSPAYPATEAEIREKVLRDIDRAYVRGGIERQIAAVGAVGDRRARLRTIRVPTVVLTGAADPGTTVEMAHDLAGNIAGAELRIIPGMGHDFPVPLVPTFADAITAAARSVER